MKDFINKYLNKKILNYLKKIIPNERNAILKKLEFKNFKNIIYLGSDYGGWSLLDDFSLNEKYIISAGLGEDASFDIEMINKYNCKVIIIDPTPRAIEHYNQIIKNSGKQKITEYTENGKQNISSYELTSINNSNFILVKNALYNTDNKELKFFSPPNKNHVSHSLNNWQNNYELNSEFILVKTITVKSILEKFNIKHLELIKLDIEGSEVEVIKNMFESNIFPKQILIEFDELNKFSKISLDRFFNIHNKILSYGYKIIKTDSEFPNFLYIKF